MALGELLRGSSAARQVGQILLRLQYQVRQCPEDLPALSDVEFRCYSQNGEDGVCCISSPCSELLGELRAPQLYPQASPDP